MSSREPQGPLRQQLERLRSVRSLRDLTGRQRTVLSFAAGLVVVIAIHTVIYWIGMRVFETEPQSLSRSLVTVVETFSTVGYGGDSPWRSTFMNLYVVWLQVVSLAITFVTLRVLIVPLFERAPVVLDSRLPPKRTTPSSVATSAAARCCSTNSIGRTSSTSSSIRTRRRRSICRTATIRSSTAIRRRPRPSRAPRSQTPHTWSPTPAIGT